MNDLGLSPYFLKWHRSDEGSWIRKPRKERLLDSSGIQQFQEDYIKTKDLTEEEFQRLVAFLTLRESEK